MDSLSELASVVGIVVYAAVVVAMVILAADSWVRGEPRRMSVVWFLWGWIALLQLVGLVAIQSGSNDMRLWYVNRVIWFLFGVVVVSMAYRAFRGWLARVYENYISSLFGWRGSSACDC